VCAVVSAGTKEEKIKLLFSTFDEDGNGELSLEEFQYASS
jgi:Ca2+-binding EF-hand superfamily protein